MREMELSSEKLGSGVDAIFQNGAKWGSGIDVMSRRSWIGSGNGHVLIASHPNLQARIGSRQVSTDME